MLLIKRRAAPGTATRHPRCPYPSVHSEEANGIVQDRLTTRWTPYYYQVDAYAYGSQDQEDDEPARYQLT